MFITFVLSASVAFGQPLFIGPGPEAVVPEVMGGGGPDAFPPLNTVHGPSASSKGTAELFPRFDSAGITRAAASAGSGARDETFLPQASAPLPDLVPVYFAGPDGRGSSPDPSSPLFPSQEKTPDAPKEPKRRSLPSPFEYPIPATEYQGYPLVGVPADNSLWPLMKAFQGTPAVTSLVDNRIRVYGWVTAEGNLSTAKNSNTPDSYWVRPNKFDMDQAVLRVDRNVDSVQTDHVDWGFRVTGAYGIDYRYFTAGGWNSEQLLKHNSLYGYDLTEVYGEVYVPGVAQGLIVRVGRWIACPDIETQFAPDNYMGSHSILFTFDTYTQTGIMTTFKLSDQWIAQAAIHSGTDMAPWYKGALPTGAFGVRWVSKDNNDAFYGWYNAINDAKFRRFEQYGQQLGHDNFNYIVGTYEHRFSKQLVTKTEAYYMYQFDAVVGGTPSAGPTKPYGGGGGIGADIPGLTQDFGVVNFTILQFTKKDFLTFRNEYYKDTRAERTGFAGVYTSDAIGWSHNFTPNLQFRPEIGLYRNWTNPAFDLGTRKNMVQIAADWTIRF
jgi:Putative beta-barrel porin-2, OmpL-like. bbp2